MKTRSLGVRRQGQTSNAETSTDYDPKDTRPEKSKERAMTIDENKLNQFMGKIVGDLGSTMSGALLVLGDRLGLYKAMSASGPVTAAELSRRTETAERYVGEWLNAQAAAGYVVYEAASGRYTLPPEQ